MSKPETWVAFLEDQVPRRQKTRQWCVVPERDKERTREQADYVELGIVKWYAPWRRYCFFPADGSLFDAACIREIAEFCAAETLKHRRARHG